MSRRQLVKTAGEIESMRVSGRILAAVLEYLKSKIAAGQTSKELATMAAQELKRLGGEPAFLGYGGFPDVICISINEEVQHTIPGERVIHEGDIVNLDFGVQYKGMITDAGITVGIGKVSPDAQRLVRATAEALAAGIEQVSGRVHVGDISKAVERRLRQDRLGIIEDLVGHGVGRELHEPPMIPNFYAGQGPKLRAGMTIAIEPMATLGGHQITLDNDQWTFRTVDGSWSAQFEHTVLVTESGSEILTRLER